MAVVAPAPLVWINGFPGTGKLTIARELINIISGMDDGPDHVQPQPLLLDNHQLIDPVEKRLVARHIRAIKRRDSVSAAACLRSTSRERR